MSSTLFGNGQIETCDWIQRNFIYYDFWMLWLPWHLCINYGHIVLIFFWRLATSCGYAGETFIKTIGGFIFMLTKNLLILTNFKNLTVQSPWISINSETNLVTAWTGSLPNGITGQEIVHGFLHIWCAQFTTVPGQQSQEHTGVQRRVFQLQCSSHPWPFLPGIQTSRDANPTETNWLTGSVPDRHWCKHDRHWEWIMILTKYIHQLWHGSQPTTRPHTRTSGFNLSVVWDERVASLWKNRNHE